MDHRYNDPTVKQQPEEQNMKMSATAIAAEMEITLPKFDSANRAVLESLYENAYELYMDVLFSEFDGVHGRHPSSSRYARREFN